MFERVTRRYAKPEFGLTHTDVNGIRVAVTEEVVWKRPFCKLIRFNRDLPADAPRQPNLIIVAPMSGHYATLLRGTVETLLPHFNVHITDWADARMVPMSAGTFDFGDYVDYVADMTRHFGGDVHLIAVCQPTVPVFVALSVLEQGNEVTPKSVTMMGGPLDTRENPTEVNTYAANHDLDWFRRNVIMTVPLPHPGFMRPVYPGFLQLTGFMTMNLDRHLAAHYDYFDHLVAGDGDSADKHREFYDEYLSVMDLTAEFYLETVDYVFLRQLLPKGEMMHHGRLIEPGAITRTAIFTVEGEKDDISGIGQTRAAHRMTPNLEADRHQHYEQPNVGHYGVFNGSRFRKEIAPRIVEFVYRWENGGETPAYNAGITPDVVEQMKNAAKSDAAHAPGRRKGAVIPAGARRRTGRRTDVRRRIRQHGGADRPDAPAGGDGPGDAVDEPPARLFRRPRGGHGGGHGGRRRGDDGRRERSVRDHRRLVRDRHGCRRGPRRVAGSDRRGACRRGAGNAAPVGRGRGTSGERCRKGRRRSR